MRGNYLKTGKLLASQGRLYSTVIVAPLVSGLSTSVFPRKNFACICYVYDRIIFLDLMAQIIFGEYNILCSSLKTRGRTEPDETRLIFNAIQSVSIQHTNNQQYGRKLSGATVLWTTLPKELRKATRVLHPCVWRQAQNKGQAVGFLLCTRQVIGWKTDCLEDFVVLLSNSRQMRWSAAK